VLARGLVTRLAARAEPMPIQHALAIVVSAASRVHAAHLAGNRLYATPETVLIRFDGVVEVEPPAAPGGDAHEDVVALGRLLAELVTGSEIPPGLAAAFASVIDVDDGPASAAELARALGFAARGAGIKLSRGELGRWARRQVHPPRLAHTLRRDDVPELGVDLGALKPKPKLADGSGEYPELMDDGVELSAARSDSDAEAAFAAIAEAEAEAGRAAIEAGVVEDDFAIDVDLDDLIEVAVAPPALAVVELPAVPVPRSIGTAILAALAVMIILAAAGVVIFYSR